MTQQGVVIISDDSDFARTVVARWQSELTVPSFTVLSGDTFTDAPLGAAQLVIFGGLGEKRISALLKEVKGDHALICVVPTQAQAQGLRKLYPRVLAFPEHEGWVDQLVLLAGECMKRVDAVRRARETDIELKESQQLATLGEYMLELRHTLNNALTSILGNAELLLLEPGGLTADMRDQLDTIRNMSLRMHEVLQRFSSLESEMRFAEKTSHAETMRQSQVLGARTPQMRVLAARADSSMTYSAKLK
jgi:signal transduction histidine kinase